MRNDFKVGSALKGAQAQMRRLSQSTRKNIGPAPALVQTMSKLRTWLFFVVNRHVAAKNVKFSHGRIMNELQPAVP